MREILDDVERWLAGGRRVAIARVVGTEGSSPREAGAAMAVNDAGEVSGSVSGGCVEGAVVSEALEILGGEHDRRVVSFGYSDDEAFAVGLTCGGTIYLFIDAIDGVATGETHAFAALAAALRSRRPVALATVVDGTGVGRKLLVEPGAEPLGTLGDPDLDRVVGRDALGELASGTSSTRHYGPHGEAREEDVTVFVESFAPPPLMVIFGAVDFTAALARVAKVLGYRVVVCDARTVFATPQRFPMADEILNEWPDRYLSSIGGSLGERDAVCVLTHDHKFDVPAIVSALGTQVGYIGAMGSRRTHKRRLALLVDAGVHESDLARLHAPIGLDLGSRTPEETAVAICAEIIAARTGRVGRPLRDTGGPIH